MVDRAPPAVTVFIFGQYLSPALHYLQAILPADAWFDLTMEGFTLKKKKMLFLFPNTFPTLQNVLSLATERKYLFDFNHSL